MTKIYFAEPNSLTWKQAAPALENHESARWGYLKYGGATRMQDPESGEVWQYMGTVTVPGRGAEHQFRHRWHPIMQKRAWLHFPTTLRPTDVEDSNG